MVPMHPSVAAPAALSVSDGLLTHPVAQTAGPESAQQWPPTPSAASLRSGLSE